ncbi:RNA pol II accessory factor, Cdc73 family-domain-containing protein [Desarmillaria tabescens]|uniref:RNA pol II accessory factor, Cdc73 family-domain-containing protein n=1 Tax=Armillaria tabescens TaxID=1929756 RepID=A0AA39JZH8_ARMTA|nr:RNA pol II accessory factor, Cdc73 family-domain-containing protein [Desarmillaria tabescens]KAK0450339.1 RNA pol II accessory factor, Cdc73 family-domain-containing protein [Desarmillaria tabescens]
MSSTLEPALTLRQAIKARQNVTYTNSDGPCSSLSSATHLVIPPHTFAKSAPTRFRKVDVTTATGPQDFYTLDALYLAWSLQHASAADYYETGSRERAEHRFRCGLAGGQGLRTINFSRAGETTTPPGTPPPRSSNLASSSPGKSKVADTPSSSNKRRYIADSHDLEVVKKIKHSVLRGTKHNNFSSIKTIYADKLKKMREASKPGAPASTPAPTPDLKMQARKARNNFPIIMISSSPTALITMHNVKRFLQESVFETSQAARERAKAEGNTKPDDLIPIYRKLTHIDPSGRETSTHARYLVVDSVEALSKFGADAWDRVVCVMTTGQAWQFKPYRWNEPTVLFHHVKGFYVSWANDPPNNRIKDWNVTELKIDQNRRHIDKSVVAHFWKILDTWTMANKPWLMKA